MRRDQLACWRPSARCRGDGKANEEDHAIRDQDNICRRLDVDGMAVDAFGSLFVFRKSENTNASDGVILKFTPHGESSVFVSNISHFCQQTRDRLQFLR